MTVVDLETPFEISGNLLAAEILLEDALKLKYCTSVPGIYTGTVSEVRSVAEG